MRIKPIECVKCGILTMNSDRVCRPCMLWRSGYIAVETKDYEKNSRSGGEKKDSGKSRVDLLSPIWLLGIGQVLEFGSRKYSANNWRKGLALSRVLGAALRHILMFLGGQNLDSETGLCHLLHASCCMMFAYEIWSNSASYAAKGLVVDDRYNCEIESWIASSILKQDPKKT